MISFVDPIDESVTGNGGAEEKQKRKQEKGIRGLNERRVE